MVNLKIIINKAQMKHDQESGYVGSVEFQVENHKEPYEITLHSKYGKEWMYGLNFLHEPGDEEEILALEELIEDNDEYYDMLINAAKDALTNK